MHWILRSHWVFLLQQRFAHSHLWPMCKPPSLNHASLSPSTWHHQTQTGDLPSAGALQEAIAEQYNDHLRELREAGLAEEASQLREVLRDLRDEERAPEGGVKVCWTPHPA